VRSKTTTVLSSKVTGTVIRLRVREGDKVRAGQLLIEIDNRDANAQLQKANAGLRQTQEGLAEVEQAMKAATSAQAAAEANKRLTDATYARYRALLERKSVSPQEFDEVKAKQEVAEAEARRASDSLRMLAAKRQQALALIDQAQADIAYAQVVVSHGRIAAPVNGITVAKHTEVGSTATPGTPLLTIEDSSCYQLEVAVDESKLGQIRIGDKARLRIDALGIHDVEAGVSEIRPAADPLSRSYAVKVDLPPSPSLRSGLYGTARFTGGQKETILIQQKAVVEHGQLVGVFVVGDSGIARLRLIKTGKRYGEKVQILSGLSEKEHIVVDGLANVSDGSRVQ
jgi:multidrug resistance efflux pump